ncbi:MAG: PAS domain-containing protein [Gammaproteobacteria bacterium]|nr:PAS domain-containing protein [Gammaproteobacteria bacterium]
MKAFISSLSFHKKLVLLTTIPFVLIIALGFSILLVIDSDRIQKEMVNDARAYIEVMTQDFASIIAIGEVDLAVDITDKLHGWKMVEGMIIYDKNHTPVYSYMKDGFADVLIAHQEGWDESFVFTQGSLFLLNPVVYKGKHYGDVRVQLSTLASQNLRASYILQGGVIVLALLLSTFLMTLGLGYYFSRPLKKIASALHQVEKTQDYSVRLTVEQDDEIGTLVDGFNTMQTEVERAHADILDQQYALEQHAIVAITDIKGAITYANKKFVEVSGYSRDELLGQDHRLLNSGRHNDAFFREMYKTIAGGNVWRGEICNQAKDGHLYWVDATIVATMDRHDKPEKYISIRTDITQQKKTDKALVISEERISMAMSVANDGIWDWHLNDNSVYFDERFYTMAGYEPNEFPGAFDEFKKRVHPQHINELLQHVKKYIAGEEKNYDVEFQFQCKDGSYIWIRGRGLIVEHDVDGKPSRFVGTHTDITQRMQVEESLKRSQSLLNATGRMAKVGGWELDAVTSDVIWTDETYRIHEMPIDSTPSLNEAFDCYHADDRPTVETALNNALDNGQPYDLEARFTTVQGNSLWVRSTCEPVVVQGVVVKLNGTLSDITDLKYADEALRRSQKMDAIGQLTGGLAHDFNNILGIIMGNVSLLENYIETDEKSQKRIDTIKHSTQRAVDLTRSLLNFTRHNATGKKVTNVNVLVENLQQLIEYSLTPQVNVEQKFDSDLWDTEFDPGDFEDALLNLMLNARDAMNGSGNITVETSNCLLDKAFCLHNIGALPGEYVRLSISDDGEGIPENMMEHIFEPFFTTKDTDEGTGLGLAMVFGFVKRSNGYITVDSTLNQGATFCLYLPRVYDEQAQVLSNKLNIEKPVGGQETILAVDDEEDLLVLVQESLQMLGYKVIVAKNGEQALAILAKEPNIDLLFSDVVMPGMSGYELAEQAENQCVKLKILLTSGYTEKAEIRDDQSRFNTNLLSKPYTQIELAKQIRQALS